VHPSISVSRYNSKTGIVQGASQTGAHEYVHGLFSHMSAENNALGEENINISKQNIIKFCSGCLNAGVCGSVVR
jgi:hypothetical protein